MENIRLTEFAESSRRESTGSFPSRQRKILQIGNYPPPECGWAIQTKLLKEEIRRRGHICEVLNINESRKIRSSEYVDVQNGVDYVRKLIRFARRGYRFQVNVNGQSKPGYILALLALAIGRLSGQRSTLSWRGGVQQKYFPRKDWPVRSLYRFLFQIAGCISCDSEAIKLAIEDYGIPARKIIAIPPFSRQNLEFRRSRLHESMERFLSAKWPVFFSYVSFRPEYDLPMLRAAMRNFRAEFPDAGFVWLGFPSKEMPEALRFVSGWSDDERKGLLLLGNLEHEVFLNLLTRCTAYIRTPMCDGVAASVLESLALGILVVASDNGTRPPGVTTYREADEADLRAKLRYVVRNYQRVKAQTQLVGIADNIELTTDWLLGEEGKRNEEPAGEAVHA